MPIDTAQRARKYVETWKRRGYSEDIPDEVPQPLQQLGLAPSYKAIACAILRNDVGLYSLGFAPEYSEWYGVLKREELRERANGIGFNMELF